jgi:murein DD-endopeptidase MepM/ murein hydrolase activator NlpD
MKKTSLLIGLILASALFLTACAGKNTNQAPVNTTSNSNQSVAAVNQVLNNNTVAANTNTVTSEFVSPLDRPAERITKKPFGIYITPRTSPVQPERFSGYHTGADFETFPDEANSAVVVKVFCAGRVVYKQWVSGYGGVFIQQCTVADQAATVLYGHLKLASISARVGDTLKAGDSIGELGQGFSHDTDGERKHLHFSIYKGSTINVKGYVSKQSDLSGWLDPQKFLK